MKSSILFSLIIYDDPPEGTEMGGDGEPIPPGEPNPYPNGG